MDNKGIAKAQQYNWRNFWVCFLVSLGQFAFGYPSSIIGTTLGEPSFLVYMGILDPKTKTVTSDGAQLEGAMSGVFQVSNSSAKQCKAQDVANGVLGRRFLWRPRCKLGYGQIRKEGWDGILCILLAAWRRPVMRSQWRDHVHRGSFLRKLARWSYNGTIGCLTYSHRLA